MSEFSSNTTLREIANPKTSFKQVGTLIVWEPTHPRARETLLLQLEDSPLLSRLYNNWRHNLRKTAPKEIFEDLLTYLRTVVFDMKQSCRSIIKTLVEEASSQEISIEYFVEKRAGLCRHFTLVAYYFLQRLNREAFLPPFSIEILRMPILVGGVLGRHAWLSVFFEDENRSFHFDPFWSIVMDKADPNASLTLKNYYGL